MSLQEENAKDIEKLYDHARIANEEMGVIKNDIAWIKEMVEKIDAKFWWIITAIIAGVVIPLIK
jgi:hypothetical protein